MKATRAKICAAATVVALLATAGAAPAAALRASTPFNDVDDNHVFVKEISVLIETGVLNEFDTDDGHFNSGDPVHPADMTRWMSNVAEKYDVDTSAIDQFGAFASVQRLSTLDRNGAAAVFADFFDLPSPHTFSDVSPYYTSSVSTLQSAGIAYGCGAGDAYCGGRPFTRGQVAAFIARFLEQYGGSRANNKPVEAPLQDLRPRSSFENLQTILDSFSSYQFGVSTSTASPPPCVAGQHPHVSSCHAHASSIPACSATAGNNRPYTIHEGGDHRSGTVAACPPPTIPLNSPDLRLTVTAGLTPVIVLQAAAGAKLTRQYEITLAPYEMSEDEQASCAASGTCTRPARPGLDYVDMRWTSIMIGPGDPPVIVRLVDGNDGMSAEAMQTFGTLPRAIEFTVADVRNPDVATSGTARINPPAIPSS